MSFYVGDNQLAEGEGGEAAPAAAATTRIVHVTYFVGTASSPRTTQITTSLRWDTPAAAVTVSDPAVNWGVDPFHGEYGVQVEPPGVLDVTVTGEVRKIGGGTFDLTDCLFGITVYGDESIGQSARCSYLLPSGKQGVATPLDFGGSMRTYIGTDWVVSDPSATHNVLTSFVVIVPENGQNIGFSLLDFAILWTPLAV